MNVCLRYENIIMLKHNNHEMQERASLQRSVYLYSPRQFMGRTRHLTYGLGSLIIRFIDSPRLFH